MQARFAASELGFSLLDPLCRSEVLPKTVEAKSVKRFAGARHLWISFPGRAELLRACRPIYSKMVGSKIALRKTSTWIGPAGRIGARVVRKRQMRRSVDIDRTVPLGVLSGRRVTSVAAAFLLL